MLKKVNLTKLQELLNIYYKNKESLYLWGKPSTGKTSIIRQFAQKKAKEMGLEYSEDKFGPNYFTMKVITMSQYDAPDLRGMPVITKDSNGENITRFIATEELPREGQGIIFFDELNLATEDVRASIYNYILEGRLSNLPNPGNKYWRVAASNSESDMSGVQNTGLALLSRFSHLEVDPDSDEIINYFLEKEFDTRIIGYLKNFTEDIFPKKYNDDLLISKANPFPRKWESASNMIKEFDTSKNMSLITDIVASCVGHETAVRFGAYCKLANKVNIPEIIKDPTTLKKFETDDELRKDKSSLYYALITEITALWYKNDKKLTNDKVIEICDNLPTEFAISMLHMVVMKKSDQIAKATGFKKYVEKVGKFII